MGNCISSDEEDEPTNVSYGFRSNMMRERRNRDVFQYYEVTRVLGEGSMGTVSSVKRKHSAVSSAYKKEKKSRGFFGAIAVKRNSPVSDKASQKEYALKTIQLNRVTDEFLEELRNEIDILKTLDHPHIVKAYEVYENRRQIFIVMEMCSGGDLYQRSPYSEKDAAKIVAKLLSAVAYMHAHNVVHRDLKFENIMFENRHKDAEIKVIDFGLSKKFLPGDLYMTEGVGTIYTMAPQVLQGVYTSKADLWSVGVITYMLLSSTKPFYHRKRRFVIDKIMRADYNFDGPAWQHVSKESKKFVSALVQMDPNKRLSATQALKHKWLSNEFPLSDRRPTQAFMNEVEEQLSTFGENSEFKKMALMVIAHKSSTEEIMKLRQAFDQYDTTNDGKITYTEFKEALAEFNYTDEEINQIFTNVDVDKNGVIYYTEFLAATLEAHGFIEEERLADAFERIDSDDTGYISKENLRALLGTDYSPARVDRLLEEVDLNKDGKISFDEFLKAFRTTTKRARKRIEQSDTSPSETNGTSLVGLDAVIPGGKYDQRQNDK